MKKSLKMLSHVHYKHFKLSLFTSRNVLNSKKTEVKVQAKLTKGVGLKEVKLVPVDNIGEQVVVLKAVVGVNLLVIDRQRPTLDTPFLGEHIHTC